MGFIQDWGRNLMNTWGHHSLWLVSHCTWYPGGVFKVWVKLRQDSAKFPAHSRHSVLGKLGSSLERAVTGWSPDSADYYIARLSSQISHQTLGSLWPWNRKWQPTWDTSWEAQLYMDGHNVPCADKGINVMISITHDHLNRSQLRVSCSLLLQWLLSQFLSFQSFLLDKGNTLLLLRPSPTHLEALASYSIHTFPL